MRPLDADHTADGSAVDGAKFALTCRVEGRRMLLWFGSAWSYCPICGADVGGAR